MRNGPHHSFKGAPQVCRPRELQQSGRILAWGRARRVVVTVWAWIVHGVVGIGPRVGSQSGKRGSEYRIFGPREEDGWLKPKLSMGAL